MAQYLSYEGLQKYDTKIKNWTDKHIWEAISQIINSAPEEFDTLKEVSDWIQNQKILNSEIDDKLKNINDIETVSQSEIDTLFD